MKLQRSIQAVVAGASLVATVAMSGGPVASAAATIHRNPLLNTHLDEPSERFSTDAPALSSRCQGQIGQLNLYPKPAPNVDLIVKDGVVQAGSQQGCSSAQNETTIAVNPRNPRNLVAGTNDYRLYNSREGRNDGSGWAYTSFDGGASWTDKALPHLTFQTGSRGLLAQMDSAGDPAVAFGNHNDVYYANIAFSRLNTANAITVNASRDGGRTWGEPAIIQIDGVDAAGNPVDTAIFNDKEWITVDPVSGTVYVTWTRFDAVSSPIVVSASHDGGRTWSKFAAVSPTTTSFVEGITPYDQGSSPQVGKDGALYVAYEASVCETLACDQPEDHDATVVARSTNGGRTFTNTVVGVNYDFPVNPVVGDTTLTGENFRLNSFPQLTIDRHSGALWLTWADDRNGLYTSSGSSVKTNGDIIVARSTTGRSWSSSVFGTPQDEAFPAIAAGDDHVAVSAYTRKFDDDGTGLDYAYWSGGNANQLAKSSVHRITTRTSDPGIQFVGVGTSGETLQGVFIGDYSAVVLGEDGVLHPCWTDFRGRPGTTSPNQDAYSQAIRLSD